MVLLEDGRASFQALQQAMAAPSSRAGLKTRGHASRAGHGSRAGLVYLAFDLLEVDGALAAALPLEERKARLAALVARGTGRRIRYADHVVGHGEAFFEQATRLGVEGIVSKRRDGVLSARPPFGLAEDQMPARAAVRGWRLHGSGGHGRVASARCSWATTQDGRLTFAGRVGTGFTQKIGAELAPSGCRPLARTHEPVRPAAGRAARQIRTLRRAGARVPVAFAEWTATTRSAIRSSGGWRRGHRPRPASSRDG